MKWISPLIFLSLVVIACSKTGPGNVDDDSSLHIIDTNDTIPPDIEINTPIAAQVFSNGSSIDITGKITDNGGLYRGSIRITNDVNNAVIKEQLYEIHGFQLYNFSLSHTASVTTPSDYTVTVLFEDHGLNQVSRSVKIKVNP